MLIRSLCAAITIAILWWPLSGFGLGLGEISVESTLASPLKAVIPLKGLERVDLDPDQFFIRLETTGRPKIQYRLERTGTSDGRIILYSTKAITEPLFNFRIEVEWDKGIIARSYDVLIDPPSYQLNLPAAELTSDVVDESSETVSEPVGSNLPATSPTVETVVTRSEKSAIETVRPAVESRREYGPIENGDSVWLIAKKVATGSRELSVYQWMYGIWKANPRAFTRSNMHRLKKHETISVPFEHEVGEISHSEAYQTYASHLALTQTTLADGKAKIVNNSVPDPVSDTVVGSSLKLVNGKLVYKELPDTAAGQPSVTAAEQPSATGLVDNIDYSDTPITDAPVMVTTLDDIATAIRNENEVVSGLIKILDAEELAGITAAEVRAVIEVPAVQNKSGDELEAALSSTLATRSDINEKSPVNESMTIPAILMQAIQQVDEFISSSLSWATMASPEILMRAIRQMDEFISGSSSWATMLFGIWVTVVLLTLVQEFRSRPGIMANLKQKLGALIPGFSSTEELAPDLSEVEDSLDTLAMALDSDDSAEPGKNSSDVDAVIAESEVYIAKGNSNKAIELLELTLELKPDQIKLRTRLLEAYYLVGATEEFNALAEQLILVNAGTDTDDVPEDENQASNKLTDKFNQAAEEDDFLVTEMIFPDGVKEVVSRELEAAASREEVEEHDETLKEVDVYLAYGLYDNAEELLILSLEANPDRAVYRSKLLDTYFATKNVADFVTQAEVLKGMGGAASRFWGRVQVMGYELAPDNELFSGGKHSSLSAFDLEIAKPETPDLDLGGDDEDNSLSSADFILDLASDELGNLADGVTDAENLIATVVREKLVTGDEEELSNFEFNLDTGDEKSIVMKDGEMRYSDAEDIDPEATDEISMSNEETDLIYHLDAAGESINPEDIDPGSTGKFNLGSSEDTDLIRLLDAAGESINPEDIDLGSTGKIIVGSSEDTDLIRPLEADGETNGPGSEDDTMKIDASDETDFEELVSSVPRYEEEAKEEDEEEDEELSFENLADKLDDKEDSKPFDGRILQFPASHGENEKFARFESDVMMTIQSVRDQIQQMNERLFSQERDSYDLKKAIGELIDLSHTSPANKNKK